MQVHYSWWIWQQSLQLNSHYYNCFNLLIKCCQTISIQANSFHARCLPQVDFSACNGSEKQVQSPPTMRTEKMRFAHPKKMEQLHYDDLAPLQFGIKTCQYVRKGTPSVPRWQHALLQPSLSPQLQSADINSNCFCAGRSVLSHLCLN